LYKKLKAIGLLYSYTTTYEEGLQCLKLWTLEERKNRQDLITVCNGLLRLKLNELFTLDDNIRGTRRHSLLGNSLNFGVRGTAVSIFL